MANDARPCRKCGRPIVYRKRWYARPPNGTPRLTAWLNAEWEDGDVMGWFETSLGVFEPANHHNCPGKPNNELQKEREKLRHDMGLDLKPILPRKKSIQGDLF
jgi:hypothetical protein